MPTVTMASRGCVLLVSLLLVLDGVDKTAAQTTKRSSRRTQAPTIPSSYDSSMCDEECSRWREEEAGFISSFHVQCKWTDQEDSLSKCQTRFSRSSDHESEQSCKACQSCVFSNSPAESYFMATMAVLLITCCVGGCVCACASVCINGGVGEGEELTTASIMTAGIWWLKMINLATDWGFTEYTLVLCDPTDSTGLYDTAYGFCVFGSILLVFDFAAVATRFHIEDPDDKMVMLNLGLMFVGFCFQDLPMFIINCEYIDKAEADIMSGFSLFFSLIALIVTVASFCKYFAESGATKNVFPKFV